MKQWCMWLLAITLIVAEAQEKNVCGKYEDYYTMKTNPNCWYDFNANLNMSQIVEANGYSLEIHRAQTPDGHILQVFRIPNYAAKAKRGPVFLQHGLGATSANFVATKENSLAFILANAGFDVWMGNFRGNEYSEEHVKYTVRDKEFWDHSIDELGLYDLPSQLNLVATRTGQKGNIIYVGHSLGTTLGLIYASTYPEEAKAMVKLFVLMAPAAHLPNMISPYRLLAPVARGILAFVEDNDIIRPTSQARTTRNIFKEFCFESPKILERCFYLLNLFFGVKTTLTPNFPPVYFNQLPGGTSLKVFAHAADLVLNRFGKFDYGLKNLQTYGSIKPPDYEIANIIAPFYVMYSPADWACTKKDAEILFSRLRPEAQFGKHEVNSTIFNHLDFTFSVNARTLVYDKILDAISRITGL